MNIMITGATTSLGLSLARTLLNTPEVEKLLLVGAEPNIDLESNHLDPARVRYISVDLTRRRRLWNLIFGAAEEMGVEVLIHLARHRSSRDKGARVHALNVESTRALLGMSERHSTIRRFLFWSSAAVYRLGASSAAVIDERHPLNFSPHTPQWLRDRVEADMTVCAYMGMSDLQVCVLRGAECLEEGSGGQLHDYLSSRICFVPAGFNPMINLLSLTDQVEALRCGALSEASGVFNIPGADTLPLSLAIKNCGCQPIPIPGAMIGPLYQLRQRVLGADFSYQLNQRRFHFNGVLLGERAAKQLGYQANHPMTWPCLSTRKAEGP